MESLILINIAATIFVAGTIVGILFERHKLSWRTLRTKPLAHYAVLFAYGLYVTKGFRDERGEWWDMSDLSAPIPEEWITGWRYIPCAPKANLYDAER